ncbi:hypothetical protein KUTeg_009499 [Tegillarca granosa]|uniref:C-type lectin domain-containing protein n=1 Tax=Tegillarca granosa TaxID=220873 RepID=A0ABQ9F421_TEGGR|nr:hypothetical protein KUTeg_009499 [Tegillarca granosa]
MKIIRFFTVQQAGAYMTAVVTSSALSLRLGTMQWLNLCYSSGAYLVRIETGTENTKDRFWIDGTDGAAEGIWKYGTSGSNIGFTDWYPSEPNNLNGDQDCAALTRLADFRWDDLRCTEIIYYICKKSVMFPLDIC